jgi:hypothetical protein
LGRRLSGLTRSNLRDVEGMRAGTPLFLFNVNDKRMHGVFEAVRSAAAAAGAGAHARARALIGRRRRRALQVAPGQLNLEPDAWMTSSAAKNPTGGSPFPAQARPPATPRGGARGRGFV